MSKPREYDHVCVGAAWSSDDALAPDCIPRRVTVLSGVVAGEWGQYLRRVARAEILTCPLEEIAGKLG
ncbi:MAG: hypothetical protein HYV95_06160 [Opitutae bacterium]|nr:hypothetical protein [Opitutae bacterium]